MNTLSDQCARNFLIQRNKKGVEKKKGKTSLWITAFVFTPWASLLTQGNKVPIHLEFPCSL